MNIALAQITGPSDPYLWLEDVTGDKALQWVKEQNALTRTALEQSPVFAEVRQRLLTILNSKHRIPYVDKHGPYLYNFWRDEQHARGLWRRTTMEEYKKADPKWESVLDLDALAKAENEKWIWSDVTVLKPDYDRCLISLSRGGADATVVREFDLKAKQFVPDGFTLPEAKSTVDWRDRNVVYVATDFGPGSMTKSGYPRIVKEWKRGAALANASIVFEAAVDDLAVSPNVRHDHGHLYEFIHRKVTTFTDEFRIRRGDQWVVIDKPADAELDTFSEFLMLRLRSDLTIGGKTYRAGSLLAEKLEDYLKGSRNFAQLFVPDARRSLQSTSSTKDCLILNELDNVCGRPFLLKLVNNQWIRTPVTAPQFGTASVEGVDPDESNEYFQIIQDYLTPSSLLLGSTENDKRETLKSLPAFFKTDGLEAKQFEAVSKDGTRVPYFLVGRKNLALDGSNPTLLYGYGGFEISMLPGYRAGVGVGWLEKGGVYVVANIRGGGEFGPTWHNAARKENRQRAYDDFIAVAEDLIARKITSPKHLGVEGGSNGGLLVGVMLTQRPDLFGAVACHAPLLDMRRYSKLLAGASWMDEYGDPDLPEVWAYLGKYSPYQNVSKDKKYPPVLFTTSTRDDRVHPGHARKMATLMESSGNPVLFYENTEGGHAGADTNEQIAYMNALAYAFLWEKLR